MLILELVVATHIDKGSWHRWSCKTNREDIGFNNIDNIFYNNNNNNTYFYSAYPLIVPSALHNYAKNLQQVIRYLYEKLIIYKFQWDIYLQVSTS